MITVLIGHRGVGKTNFLQRIRDVHASYKQDVLTVDLDQEIAKKVGLSVLEIFAKMGEQKFREIESSLFRQLYEQYRSHTGSVVIALGAGFEFVLPSGVHVLWVRRTSDDRGRIFLDRPRLEIAKRPLDEFLSRGKPRSERFRQMAREHCYLREGALQDPEIDAFFWGLKEEPLGGSITVMPWMLYERYFEKRKKWQVRFYELRDDLLNREQIMTAMKWIPQKQRILARRRRESGFTPEELQTHKVDWPLELGVPPRDVSDLIVSLHDRSKLLEQDLERLAFHKTAYLKFAGKIRSLAELRTGHRWWSEHPERRSFLPNSESGDFRWYRSLWGRQMEIAYVREDEGTSLDQPLLAEWLSTRAFEKHFAAILGDPVEHSWTPVEQQAFFAEHGCPVVKIRISREEGSLINLELLRSMGLVAAAVTSPLKPVFFPPNTLNTVAWDFAQGGWQGINTDGVGMSAALAEVKAAGISVERWAVWGGGGTLPVLKEQLGPVSFFAARTGHPRSAQDGPLSVTQGLVWAAGNETAVLPPSTYRPLVVLDLSYTENSLAREFALTSGARYFSGSTLFRAQAAAQREFFTPLLAHLPRRMAAK